MNNTPIFFETSTAHPELTWVQATEAIRGYGGELIRELVTGPLTTEDGP